MKIFGIISNLIIQPILNGWVFTILWKWFIVSIFGMKLITIPQGIGLAVFISFITYRADNNNKNDESYLGLEIIMSLIYPIVFLIYGWIISLFI